MSSGPPTHTGFGASTAQGAHVFLVRIPADRTAMVHIIELRGFRGELDGGPREIHRVKLRRTTWSWLADEARKTFNEELKRRNLPAGRWLVGDTLVDRVLGRELCVLAWAAEHVPSSTTREAVDIIATQWRALRREERLWWFGAIDATGGRADDTARGRRRAIYHFLSDGEKAPATRSRSLALPSADPSLFPLPLLPGSSDEPFSE